jgi:vacuolar-type H+-ATPase subunit C/Vma6
MSRGFELAYTYARVCGSLARSFLGDKAASLATSPRVGEAWRIVFSEAPPVLPEAQLADQAEKKLQRRADSALRSIAGNSIDHEPFFACLIRNGEYSYVKRLLSAIVERSASAPESAGLELGVDVSAYPDLEKMLGGSRYRWIVDAAHEAGEKGVASLADLPAIKNKLDKQYYLELWLSLDSVAHFRRGSLRDLLRLDAELQNVVWALRLKRYYAFQPDEIEGLLIDMPGVDVKSSALDAVRRRLDSRSDWASWKWAHLVSNAKSVEGSAAGAGEGAAFDVRSLESAAHRYQYRCLYHRLHLENETYVPLYAYYRIKELETRAIHGIIEGIKLEAPAAEIGAFALDTTGGAA